MAGVIYLRGADMEALKAKLRTAEGYSAALADTVTASVAAEGRRKRHADRREDLQHGRASDQVEEGPPCLRSLHQKGLFPRWLCLIFWPENDLVLL